jgi:hypothetical protein
VDRNETHPEARLDESHQTRRKSLFERLAREALVVRGMERHHPAGMVDTLGAIAVARGERASKRIL